MIPFENVIVFSSVFSIDMDMSLFSKKIRILYFQKFSVYKTVKVSYFTRTRNKFLSLKLCELKWNSLKQLREEVK